MVNLGYMLPTDEEHNKKIGKISKSLESSIETVINYLIDDYYDIWIEGKIKE